MKVLLVDDEPRVLEGLERLLFHANPDWEIATSHGGGEALDRLSADPFDVIISDIRMPGMDGATLLGHVRDRFPGMARIVLSGHADDATAERALACAHQFLSKPCQPDRIVDALARVATLRELLADPALRRAVGAVGSLPATPSLYAQLSHLLASDSGGVREVASVLARDPAMAAKLLQIVNSSFFFNGRVITDVGVAVARLGLATIRNLMLCAEIFAARGVAPLPGVTLEEMQRLALRTGQVAARLVPHRPADAFIAGLLADMGLLITAARPGPLREAAARALADGRPLHEVERALTGTTHAEVGAYLIGLWGLPHAIVEAVAYHHRPAALSGAPEFSLAGALHVAAALVHGAPVDEAYLSSVGVADRLAEWRAWAAEA